jgi:hypothetical protein
LEKKKRGRILAVENKRKKAYRREKKIRKLESKVGER